jgi:hypothetical protein
MTADGEGGDRVMKKKWLSLFLSLAALVITASFFLPSPTRQYCWLVFGDKGRVKVRVCHTAQGLFLDFYVDGRRTGRHEEFTDHPCRNVTVEDPDNQSSFVITQMAWSPFQPGLPTMLSVQVDIHGPVEYREYSEIHAMSPDLDRAPLAHFHGPLKVEAQTIKWQLPAGLALRRGNQPSDLYAWIGTTDAEKSCWVVVWSKDAKGQSPLATGVFPFAEVQFPANRSGDLPITKRYPLDQFC